MDTTKPAPAVYARLLKAQRSEITEYHIYEKLAAATGNPHNAGILQTISKDELRHYGILREYTGQEVPPFRIKMWLYYVMAKTLGLAFSLKLMERGEEGAQTNYEDIGRSVAVARSIESEEDVHEQQLLTLIDEERLRYLGAIVRGLNEALVELAGALTGFTLALRDAGVVATIGLITGLVMSLSLAGTEYLATKSEDSHQHPVKAALYTGIANAFTVMLLIVPYLAFSNTYIALAVMLLVAIAIIWFFSFYISVAREISFRRRFVEMTAVSLGIASISFAVGFLARTFLHVEV